MFFVVTVLEGVFAVVRGGTSVGCAGYEEVAEGTGEMVTRFVVVDDEVGVGAGVEGAVLWGWCV